MVDGYLEGGAERSTEWGMKVWCCGLLYRVGISNSLNVARHEIDWQKVFYLIIIIIIIGGEYGLLTYVRHEENLKSNWEMREMAPGREEVGEKKRAVSQGKERKGRKGNCEVRSGRLVFRLE